MFSLSSFCSLFSTVISSFQQIIDSVWAPYSSLLPGISKPTLSSLLSPFLGAIGCS